MLEYYFYAYGNQIVMALLAAVFGALGLAARKLAVKYLNTETKRTVAKIAAQFVEQVWNALHGEDKLQKALETAEVLLRKQGVPFDADEMRIFIEAAVAEFNDAFHAPEILEGIAVEDLTDEQLRSVLPQCGIAYTENMTREEMLAALEDKEAEAGFLT